MKNPEIKQKKMKEVDYETEESFSSMVTVQNRKQKKSGGWQALGLDENVYKGIQKKGYRQPTPIQRKAIPLVLEGRDVVGMARTGSGKTAAFLVPLFQLLKRRNAKAGARALLISPTRELAVQTFQFVKEIGKYCGLRAAVIVGGDSLESQFGALHENPDLLIGTPGRLLHLVVEMNLKLDSVQYVVFDEADRLFEMGFLDQLKEILQRLPDSRQTLLFSATLPKMLVDFARAGLNDPTLVRLDVDSKIGEKLDMSFLYCRGEEKLPILLFLLRSVLDQFPTASNSIEDKKKEKSSAKNESQTLVFVATKHHCEYLKEMLELAGFSVTYLYSSLDPGARKINISKFRRKEKKILIVTDVAARGVDIPILDNVINFHFPPKAKLFVHRVGRVARAGRSGRAISLISADEYPYVLDLFLFLGRPLTITNSSTANETEKAEIDSLGGVPHSVVESEEDTINTIRNNNADIVKVEEVAVKGMKNYLRSRPAPSTESIKRSKKDPQFCLSNFTGNMTPHAIFQGVEKLIVTDSLERNNLLENLKNYKPNLTVFETNTGSKNQEWTVMKAKRKAHQKYVGWKQAQQTDQNQMSPSKFKSQPAETAGDDEIKASFSKIIAPNSNISSVFKENQKKKRKKQDDKKDKEHYIPNRPSDFHSEQGLAVEGGSKFEENAKEAVLDFTMDEEEDMRKQKNNAKIWDRKKKKFVGKDDSEPKKKRIKTESGVWIPATYKTNLYKKWQQKQKVDSQEEDSEFTTENRGRRGSRFAVNKGSQRTQKGQARSELKSKEQILKERKRKERLNSYQKHRSAQKGKKKGKPGGKGGGGKFRKGKKK